VLGQRVGPSPNDCVVLSFVPMPNRSQGVPFAQLADARWYIAESAPGERERPLPKRGTWAAWRTAARERSERTRGCR